MVVKCYYEILNVSQDATDDVLKKSYRKLALLWHPDKNLDNVEEAKEQFQLVQQAYEVLSDAQERAWYDKHRDSILKGGLGKDYNDESLNIYPYFSTSCYKGYGDDEKGFYAVYREVFNKLAAEDAQFDSDIDSDDEIPDFGDSQSDYESKVHAFYSYWQSFQTKRSFSWLDEYDTRTAPNRRVARLMEKENKKIRDAAKKEKNEQIRTLVSFVRKRDKRVQQYSKLLEERAAQNADKVKQIKLKQKQERNEEIQRQIKSQSEWSKFSNFEKELKEIEETLLEEFKEDMSEECDSENEEEIGSLYCSACNKLFKTEQAFVNHEKSKKHKEKVEEMMFDDASLESPSEELSENNDELSDEQEKLLEELTDNDIKIQSHDSDVDISEEELLVETTKKNKKKNKNKINIILHNSSDSDHEFVLNNETDSESETRPRNRKNRRKQNTDRDNPQKHKADSKKSKKIPKTDSNKDKLNDTAVTVNNENMEDNKPNEISSSPKLESNEQVPDINELETNEDKQKNKRKKNKNISQTSDVKVKLETECKKDHTCKACTTSFKSNNELFKHLKKTGHAMPISSKEPQPTLQQSTKSKKKNKN